jgi:hypothetical protein
LELKVDQKEYSVRLYRRQEVVEQLSKIEIGSG